MGQLGVLDVGGVGEDGDGLVGAGGGDLVGPADFLRGAGVVPGAVHGKRDVARAPVVEGGDPDAEGLLVVLGIEVRRARSGSVARGDWGAVDKDGAALECLGQVTVVRCGDLPQDRQQVAPDPRDGGLPNAEQVAGQLLGQVVAHLHQNHRHGGPEPEGEVVPLPVGLAGVDLEGAGDQLARQAGVSPHGQW
nr:hypothetical protein [Xylanimonas allomyrinae]